MRLARAAIAAGFAATFILGATRDGAAQVDRADVVKAYADIGQAMHEDALARARVLEKALRGWWTRPARPPSMRRARRGSRPASRACRPRSSGSATASLTNGKVKPGR
jgi:uncharacterized iron-regulated protein